jgi:hypothetical protein
LIYSQVTRKNRIYSLHTSGNIEAAYLWVQEINRAVHQHKKASRLSANEDKLAPEVCSGISLYFERFRCLCNRTVPLLQFEAKLTRLQKWFFAAKTSDMKKV